MGDSEHLWEFFLAHAGSDALKAEELYDLLAPQARVFLDSRTLRLGDDWDAELPRAQARSLVTVVLVSSATDQAYYQREEIATAIELARADQTRHRVVPIYLDGATPESTNTPYGLRVKHGLRVEKGEGLTAVALRLRNLLAQLTEGSLTAPGHASATEGLATPGNARVGPVLVDETVVSESATARVRRGRHPVHGPVLVKEISMIPDESADLVTSRHYRTLLGDRLIEVGRDENGKLFEILRDIPGYDLSSVVRENNVIVGALLDILALEILRQLAALHGAPRPVIHRDVRPTNLILNFVPIEGDSSGRSKSAEAPEYRPVVSLIDFDTACFEHDQQTPWGAHGFAAPEQREGRAILSSDLFSLVSSLYFLATADIPPDANQWVDGNTPRCEALFKGDFTTLSEVYGHAALYRCWSRSASKRPASAVAFFGERRVPGTRMLTPRQPLGRLLVGREWEVDLFDREYHVRRL